MTSKRISIKEIAKISGVSVATVSRVINNNGRFSEETRKKVMKVIKETNYETNVAAKSLRMKKSNSIGILVPDITNPFFSQVVQQIESILFASGYATIICNTARSKEKELAYLKMLEGKMIDGLIVISGVHEFSTEDMTESIPLVCIDRKPKDKGQSVLIESNHYQGGFLATEELLINQCQNPIILMHHRSSSSSKERLKGYKDALEKKGILFDEKKHMIQVDIQEGETREQAVERVLNTCSVLERKIDGIFAINDYLAVNALGALEAQHIKVPEEVRIIGFDDAPISQYCSPKLSTIRQNVQAIATDACESLLQLIQQKTVLERHQVVPVALIKRGTT